MSELGKIGDLMVVSRQSVLRDQESEEPFPAIAWELGVDGIVEGSVFLAGDSVRITAQLVRVSPEQHLWTDSYRGALSEALVLQTEVARAIAGAVQGRLTPRTGTRLPTASTVTRRAQEAYLRGLYDIERVSLGTLASREEVREAFRSAIAHLEEAVALEPEWAAARAKLALAYHWKASAFPEVEAELVPKSKAAALRALELDPNEAQAHASLGFVRFFFERDWEGAERAIRRALELDPNAHHGTYALYLRALGRYDEAVEHFRQAEARRPASRFLKREVVAALFCSGRYEEALAQAEHVSALWPERERAHIRYFLGHVHSVQSRHAEAIAAYEQAVALSDSAAWALGALAHANAHAGDEAEARRILALLEPEQRPSIVYVTLGEVERAVAIVEADFGRRGIRAFSDLRCFPEWETLRTQPRIRELLAELRLPGG